MNFGKSHTRSLSVPEVAIAAAHERLRRELPTHQISISATAVDGTLNARAALPERTVQNSNLSKSSNPMANDPSDSFFNRTIGQQQSTENAIPGGLRDMALRVPSALQCPPPGLLPTTSAERKGVPLWTGLVKYFPLALAEIAKVSAAGGKQHNPDKPLFWDRTKSQDHKDCLLRHLFESGTVDTDGQLHSAKVAWRALANLEVELEGKT